MITSTVKSITTTPTHLMAKLDGPVVARLPLDTNIAAGQCIRLQVTRRMVADVVYLDATLAP